MMRPVLRVRRNMSSSPNHVTSQTRMWNLVTAGALLSFVYGVYHYTLSKIKDKDELQMVIDMETKKN